MKKTLAYVGFVAAIVAIWAIVAGVVDKEDGDKPLVAPESVDERYSSDSLGLSFSFPSQYDLTEADRSTGERSRRSLVLWKDGYVPPEGGEGPTEVTVDVFQNDLDGYTAASFATSAAESNWKLGSGALTPRTVGGEEGVEYAWSGLYEGKSVVIARPGHVYVFSVTWMDPSDPTLDVFDRVLETVEFSK